MKTAFVSVIILTFRQRNTLKRCLDSLAQATRPTALEILIVSNGAMDPALMSSVSSYQKALPELRLFDIDRSSLGQARNLAVQQARGEVLCFLDDDVAIAPDYFQVLEDKLRRFPDAAVIGGPNRTFPYSPPFQRLAGYVLGCRFGAWAMRRRYTSYPTDTWTDDRGMILCNMCIRKSILDAESLRFDEQVDRNEENLLLEKLRRRGRKLLHSPDLVVYHERRATFLSFCKQCMLSGKGRSQMTRRMPGSFRPIYAAPLLLLASIPAALASPRLLSIPLAVYLTLDLMTAVFLTLSARENLWTFPALVVLFPSAHLSYAAGLVLGLINRQSAAQPCGPVHVLNKMRK